MRLLLIFKIVLACGRLEEPLSEAEFITLAHTSSKEQYDHLTDKVHDTHWDISYGIPLQGNGCGADEAIDDNDTLTEAITTALQVWLQPLKELRPELKFVDDFRYHREDLEQHREEYSGADEIDLRVTFTCQSGRSSAWLTSPPVVLVNGKGIKINRYVMLILVHEIGHAFRMEDVYDSRRMRSRGGLKGTAGWQPSSVMSWAYAPVNEHDFQPGSIDGYLSKDDRNGIRWLYMYHHEDLRIKNCHYHDYIIKKGSSGCTPRHPFIFEIKQGQPKWALEVLQDDPSIDINAQETNGRAALHYATREGQVEVVKALLARNEIKVNSQDEKNFTALHFAAQFGRQQITALLLQHEDIDTSIEDDWGLTARQRAQIKGHVDIVQLFDSRDSNNPKVPATPDAPEVPDTSPAPRSLLAALEHGDPQTNIMAIINNNRNSITINAQDKNSGNTALHYAAQLGYVQVVDALLTYDTIKVSLTNKVKDTPLHIAAQFGQAQVTAQLLASAGNQLINLKNDNGRSALYQAVWHNKLAAVRELLKHNDINPNLRDTEGNTALHVAAQHNRLAIAELLLDAWANPIVTNKKRQRARDLAQANGHAEMVALIDASWP